MQVLLKAGPRPDTIKKMWTAFLLLSLTGLSLGLIDCGTKQQHVALNQASVFTLPDLPYPYDFLAPALTAKQVYIHHDKHHQKYVDSLNAGVLTDPALFGKTMLTLFANNSATAVVQKWAGGHYNHLMYWWTMTTPQCSSGPAALSPLANAINAKWGSFAGFKAAFNAQSNEILGSGWTWLCANATDGTLLVTSTYAQLNPLMGTQPVQCLPFLTLDQWEHAYYIQYMYKRDAYIDHWWRSIDWNVVSYFYDAYVSKGQAVPF